ncbi:hypothetical protein AAC387_Pa03g0326 [Persea americana]
MSFELCKLDSEETHHVRRKIISCSYCKQYCLFRKAATQVSPLVQRKQNQGLPILLHSSSGDPAAVSIWKSQLPNIQCRIQNTDLDAVSPPVSLCRMPSPVLRATRSDLSAACQALVGGREAAVREHREGFALQVKGKGKGVPVFVMLPPDSVTTGNRVNRKKAMNASLQALRSVGVEGVMVDVWRGLVEREGPGYYEAFL